MPNHRISSMRKLLRVSKSGFYDWRHRAPSARTQADALLSEQISRIHRDSRELDGRELRLHPQSRADLPSLVAEPTESQDGFSAEYIEGFYNTRRRHSALGHLGSSEYEEVRLRGDAVA